MYDSRSDHPRTRHAHAYCRGEWSRPMSRRPAEKDDIAEQLEEMDGDVLDLRRAELTGA